MPKTERNHRRETLVQEALRAEHWHDDPVLREWVRSHRRYRQALEAREAHKRLIRLAARRGLRQAQRERRRMGLQPYNRSADRYLPGHCFRPETIPACECETFPTCTHRPRKHRLNKAEKSQRRRAQEWAVLRERQQEEYWAALWRDLGLDHGPVSKAPAQPAATDCTRGSATRLNAREEYERRLVEESLREMAAAGTIGGLDAGRRKFYREDEFGIGYLVDEN